MKNLFVAFFLACSLSCLGNGPFSTHTFSSLVASTIRDAEVSTTNGCITVDGNITSEAIIEMQVTVVNSGSFLFGGDSWSFFGLRNNRRNWSDEDIKQTIEEDFDISIKVEGGKLYAIAKTKKSCVQQQKLRICFKISVPSQVNSDLQTSNGKIQVGNLSGSHNFRTSNGSLVVENVSGKIVGRTSNGSLTVTNSGDDLNLTTSNGRITAKDSSGKIILRTSNGSVSMSNLNGDISATTSNSSVTANGVVGYLLVRTSNGRVRLNEISGSVNARTSNGGMTVTMGTVSNNVTLTTSNGGVNLTVPVANGYDLQAKGQSIVTSGLANFSGKKDNRNIEGRMGNGGARIAVNTSSGRVNLSFN